MKNQTYVMEFVLLGFQGSRHLRLSLFCLIFFVYLVTVYGNLLIIALVSTSKILHTPMYFFISQLSISDILVTSDIVPNLLYILPNNGQTITYFGCMTQLFFFCAAETFECLLLTVMSYDRYVAICNPLRYTSIMTYSHSVRLAVTSWMLGLSIAFLATFATTRLKFCGHNIIDHLMCDLVPLQALACSDTFPIKLQMYLLSIPILLVPSVIIVISYVNIVRAVLRISSNTSRQKAFSTCSSHLTVVSIFYCTIFGVYVLPPKVQISDFNKILSLLYTVFTPLINPIIYSFRNKDIKKAAQETIHRYL